MKANSNHPLVTIVVSTYNSSKFIIETLDSFVAQTYPNLELIIGDDKSTDDTLINVRSWLSKESNKSRFCNVIIIEVEVNTGVSANANRSLQKANGDWIKFIGADDVLLPNCISDNMTFVCKNADVRVLFSRVSIYRNTFEPSNLIVTTPDKINSDSIIHPQRTVESQYQMLLRNDCIHFTPSIFLHRETLLSIGGFDERYKLLEDYPLWLNLTRLGYKLFFMNTITVNYRTHPQAINNTGEQHIVNPNYFKHESFRRVFTYPNLPVSERLNQYHIWYASQLFRYKTFNTAGRVNSFIHDVLTIYLNPFRYYLKLKKSVKSNKHKAK